MNKAELIEALSAHYDGNKTEAAKALNAVVQTITYKTAAGEKVSITGFGVFEKVHRSARMVRNPRTVRRILTLAWLSCSSTGLARSRMKWFWQ